MRLGQTLDHCAWHAVDDDERIGFGHLECCNGFLDVH